MRDLTWAYPQVVLPEPMTRETGAPVAPRYVAPCPFSGDEMTPPESPEQYEVGEGRRPSRFTPVQSEVGSFVPRTQ
jgi:hypothetical protein